MPRLKATEIVNNFSQGLITEATGLNFPENACTETWNCKFDYKGIVTRRLGLDYENGHETDGLTRSDSVITEYVWEAPRGDGTKAYVVVQVGNILRFYDRDNDGPLSPGMESFTVDLDSYDISGNPGTKTAPCQFSAGKGYLFVTHPYCDPLYISVNAAYDAVTATAITIKIRDFEGLASTSTYPDFTTRPTSTRAALDDFDEYNLLNQGWARSIRTSGGSTSVALDAWDTSNTTMPALSDIWYLYATTDEPPTYSYGNPETRPPANFRAPMGYYILNAFLQERDVASGIAGLSNDDVTSGYFRPRTNAFYAGRVFYAGVDSQGYNNTIYFSQIIERDEQFGWCYQVNDPTDSENTDLLPSDGGTIKILDAANIVKLFVMGPQLLVFATNGVWAISGSATDGLGFAANDYTVRKLSSVGAISAYSFVDVEGMPVWWNYEGIWTVVVGDLGTPQVENLSRTTINSFYIDSVPVESKFYAKGAYNRSERLIQWVYKSAAASDTDDLHEYDRILNLNVQTNAFYPWSIDTTAGVKITGIISTRGSNDSGFLENVTDGGADVTDTGGEVVWDLATSTAQAFAQVFHYLVCKVDSGTTFNFTWAKERDNAYVDWDTPGTAVNYDSYLITGYRLIGEAQRFFQSNYVFVYLNTVDDSSCYFQSIWDYSTSESSGRFSNAQQVYRSRTNTGVQQARVKARGKGRVMQFKFYSEDGKPFEIIGWSTWSTQNSDP